MRRKTAVWFVLGLIVLSTAACNLSDLSVLLNEPVTSEPTAVEAAVLAPATIVVEVTSTPPPAVPKVVVDIEEQLVTDVYARIGPAVVCITAPQRFGECIGSGFVIDREGHVITNNHVAEAANELLVTLADEHSVPAEVVGADPGSDLAVLKIDVLAADLTVAELGESAKLRVGQRAIAIGNPSYDFVFVKFLV